MLLDPPQFPPRCSDLQDRNTTIGVLITRAALSPRAMALVEIDGRGASAVRSWTYESLRDDAARLAVALLSRFEPGDRIAIWADNSPEWVLLSLATGFAGLTLVAIDPGCSPRELSDRLAQSAAVGLFVDRKRDLDHRAALTRRAGLEIAASASSIREITDLGDTPALWSKRRAVDGLPEVRPVDPAYIQYEGAANQPARGVVLLHRGLTAHGRMTAAAACIGVGDSLLHMTPMHDTLGGGALTLGAIQAGCRLILTPRSDATAVLDLIAALRIPVALGTPSLIAAMIAAQARAPRNLAALRLVVAGGAPVPPGLSRHVMSVLGCDLLPVHGQQAPRAVPASLNLPETGPIVQRAALQFR